MKFKIWIENEASLGASTPEMAPPAVNRGTGTPASDEVKRTGLQPQVDAKTANDDSQDDILAIDAKIEDMDLELPDNEHEGSKINQFKKLWSQLKEKWDQIKMSQEKPDPSDQGFGDMTDPEYDQMMQAHPNMVPVSQDQGPHGPGIFGQS